MKKILIKNIKGLVQVGENIPSVLKGAEMKVLPIIENAFLALEDGMVVAYGSMEDWGGIEDWRDLEICIACILRFPYAYRFCQKSRRGICGQNQWFIV